MIDEKRRTKSNYRFLLLSNINIFKIYQKMHLESSNIYKDEICHTLEVYTSTSKVFLRGVLLPEYFKLLCCLIKEGILLIVFK